MDQVPAFISVVFMVTTFITVGIFLFATRVLARTHLRSVSAFHSPLLALFTIVVASSGFYLNTASLPPRLFVFGLAPALLLILGLFVFARSSLITALPLTLLNHHSRHKDSGRINTCMAGRSARGSGDNDLSRNKS
jgi:hypothetical protein